MAVLPMPEWAVGSTPKDLHVHLLGPPAIAWQGIPLKLARRQVRALLFYLVAAAQPVARDYLCFLFWPDTTETTARCNLSRLVSILQGALPDPTLFHTAHDQIGLIQHAVRSDLQALECLWSAWEIEGQPVRLKDAAALYRGPFLDGFSLPGRAEYEAWITKERQGWEQTALQVLAALVDNLAARGDYAGAITYAQRYLEIDDLNEEIHRRLIELHALAGDRAAATRQYECLATVLERELGLDPLPETQALFRAVQVGEASGNIQPAASKRLVNISFPNIPLVGREEAWRVLQAAYSRTCRGRGQAVLVSGEAGIGKSRLVHDFCASVESRCLLLTGACYPETQILPLQPVVEALRSSLNTTRFSPAARPEYLAEIARLLPQLTAQHPVPAEPVLNPAGWSRARLFESLEWALAELATGVRPLLLFLDDLHWADPATLDWLACMGHRLASRRLLIIGVYRSEQAFKVAELTRRLARQGVLHEIPLAGLDEIAVHQLLCHFDATFCDRAPLAQRICAATGGNPFFMLELAKALVEPGGQPAPPDNPERMPLPDSVRAVIRLRVARLSPTARQVLEAAAVLGTFFDFDAVYLTSGRQEYETVAAIEELLARQLVTTEHGGYRFRHELTREAVYLDLNFHRCRLLHRRAAKVLEQLRPAETAAPVHNLVGDQDLTHVCPQHAEALADVTDCTRDQELTR